MLIIRSSQYEQLSKAIFDAYVQGLVDRLGAGPFAESCARWFPEGWSRDALENAVRLLIDEAESLGIECEGDVTPYVLLKFSLDETCREAGLEGWITAIHSAVQIPVEDRLDAVYELLPKHKRSIIFEDDPIG
jgi:hypothetical protein